MLRVSHRSPLCNISDDPVVRRAAYLCGRRRLRVRGCRHSLGFRHRQDLWNRPNRHRLVGRVWEPTQGNAPTPTHTDVSADMHQGKHCVSKLRNVFREKSSLRGGSDWIARTNSTLRVDLSTVQPTRVSCAINGSEPTLRSRLHQPV